MSLNILFRKWDAFISVFKRSALSVNILSVKCHVYTWWIDKKRGKIDTEGMKLIWQLQDLDRFLYFLSFEINARVLNLAQSLRWITPFQIFLKNKFHITEIPVIMVNNQHLHNLIQISLLCCVSWRLLLCCCFFFLISKFSKPKLDFCLKYNSIANREYRFFIKDGRANSLAVPFIMKVTWEAQGHLDITFFIVRVIS